MPETSDSFAADFRRRLADIGAGTPLDEAYIDDWADAWEVRDRWEEARRQLP